MKLKFSRKLTPKAKTELAAAKVRLEKAMKRFEAFRKTLSTNQAIMRKLESDHEKHQGKAATGDADAELKLIACQSQRARLADTIAYNQSNVTDWVPELFAALNDAQNLVSKIACADIEKQHDDIVEKKLAEHYSRPGRARCEARKTDSLRMIGMTFNPDLGLSAEHHLLVADRCIPLIDALLANEPVFTFEAQKPAEALAS